MKLNITIENLMELSENQKKSLRSLWTPQKYDLAVAFICMNAETEEMDNIEFAVGDVLLREIRREKRFEARKYPALYDAYDVTLRSLRQVDDVMEDEENNEETKETEATIEEDFDFTYLRQEDYFNMEYCLPLFNIGQMFKLLEDLEYKESSYRINYDLGSKKYHLAKMEFGYVEGEEYEDEELCNLLWNRLKDYLD